MSNALLIVFVLVSILISVLWGFLRGLSKSRIRGISVILCAVGAIVLAIVSRQWIVSDWFISELVLPFVQEMENAGIVKDALGISQTLNEVLLHCITSVITPILCILYFLILSFLSWFVFLILSLVCGEAMRRHNERSRFSRLRAAAWGLIQGLVIAFIFVLPVAVELEIVPIVADEVLKSDVLKSEEEESVTVFLDEYAKPMNNGYLKMYRRMGGSALCNLMTDFEIDGKEVDFSKEARSVTSFGCHIVRLTKTKVENYGPNEALVFVAIADSFADSELLPTIGGEIIYNATEKWIAGEKFLGVGKPTFGDMSEIFDSFFSKLLEILNSDACNGVALEGDFRTVAEMVAVFAENGVFDKLSDPDKLMSALSSNGIINSLVEKLGENDSMKVLIPEILNMGMRAIATTLEIPKNTDEVYGTLLSEIANAVNYARRLDESDRVEHLSQDLAKAFDKAGLTAIDPVLTKCYAISMVQDLMNSDKGEITSADVQAFFAVFAISAGQTEEEFDFTNTVYEGKTAEELQESGAATLVAAQELLLKIELSEEDAVETRATEALRIAYSDLLATDDVCWNILNTVKITQLPQTAVIGMTASIRSNKALITDKVTLKELLADSDAAAQKLNAENLNTEADAIAAIVETASDLQNEMNHNSDLNMDTVSQTFGGILDSLNKTVSLGEEKTAKLFTAVLQSETVRKSADMDMATATQMALAATDSSKGKVNYTQTMQAVAESVDVFTTIGSDGDEVNDEQLESLVKNVNPQTASMIEVYMTSERIESYKVSPKYSDTSSELISSTFHYMGESSDMDDAQYKKEAEALNQVLGVALSAKENSSEQHLFTKDGQNGVFSGNATSTVETFMNSEALSHGLRTTMLDENGNVKEDKQDAFDLGAKLPENSTDREDCEAAIAAYYAEHGEEKNCRETLLALSALLGVDGESILN